MPSRLQYGFMRYWPVWLVLVIGLVCSAAVGWILHRDAIKHDGARFEAEASQIALALEQNMERYEERLARLADYCAQFEEMPAQIWSFRSQTMTDLGGNLPAVIHAVYCPKVVASNFMAHLERGRQRTGLYMFDSEARSGREFALPVWQAYSRPGFVLIQLGTDMAQETNWHPSLHSSLNTARGSVSPQPMQMARTNGTMEMGFWFALTLFAVDQKTTTWKLKNETEQEMSKRHAAFKRAAARGSLAVFISTDHMVDRHNDAAKRNRLDARLYASAAPTPETLFNSVSPRPKNPRYQRLVPMKWYGRHWALELTSTPLFEADSLRYRSWMAMGSGAAITLLAAVLTGVSLRARARQEGMTAEVVEARDALAAVEKERERLGHDLHDGAIQSLYAVQLGLTRTAQSVESSVPSAARVLNETRERVDEVIAELRRFIRTRDTKEKPSAPVGLDDVLAAMIVRLQPTTATELIFHADLGAAARLSVAQAVQLTQIARTALGNCLRHARARHVRLTLHNDGEHVRLEIADDGVGFVPDRTSSSGMGLQTMRARAAEAGGMLSVDSSPGAGTRVIITIPAPAQELAPELDGSFKNA